MTVYDENSAGRRGDLQMFVAIIHRQYVPQLYFRIGAGALKSRSTLSRSAVLKYPFLAFSRRQSDYPIGPENFEIGKEE